MCISTVYVWLNSLTHLLLSSMTTSCSGLAMAELSKTLLASVSEIDSSDAGTAAGELEAAAALNELLDERGDDGGVETRCFAVNSRLMA